MNWFRISGGKSGAREVAVSLLMMWAFLTGYICFYIEPEGIVLYREVYGVITTAIFTFALGAFGIHKFLNREQEAAPYVSLKRGRGEPESAESVRGAV